MSAFKVWIEVEDLDNPDGSEDINWAEAVGYDFGTKGAAIHFTRELADLAHDLYEGNRWTRTGKA